MAVLDSGHFAALTIKPGRYASKKDKYGSYNYSYINSVYSSVCLR
jgi:hypothetical protein